MAITKTDFKNLPTNGLIPEDRVPSSEFAVSYFFSIVRTGNPSGFDASFDGTVILHVLDAAGAIKYVITLKFHFNVFILGMPGFSLYTWNYVPSLENISGTIGDGPDAPPMKTLGTGTFGTDPSDGFGTSDLEVFVESRVYSKIFTEPLEPGDKIVVFHRDLGTYGLKQNSLSLATQSGESDPGLYDPRCGQQFRAVDDGTGMRVLRSRHSTSPVAQEDAEWGDFEDESGDVPSEVPLHNLSLWRGPGDALFLLGRGGGEIYLFRSFDEGENWELMMATASTVTPLASCLCGDGSIFFVYGLGADNKPAYLILKNQSGGWVLSESGACEGEGLPTSGVNALELSSGGLLRLLATQRVGGQSGLLFFTSADGKTYTQETVQ
jgi:hypothetical protein